MHRLTNDRDREVSHQGPSFMDTVLSKKGTVPRIYLPPDANCVLSVAERANQQ